MTFQEFGAEKARLLKAAAKEAKFKTKNYGDRITESDPQVLAKALQELKKAIDALPASERERATEEVAKALGLPSPKKFGLLLKESSNDSFMDLAGYWHNVLVAIETP